MDWIEKLWPVIQSGGAALTVGSFFVVRWLVKQLEIEGKKNDALTAKFIELSTISALAIDRQAGQTATHTETLRRITDRA